MLDYSGDERPDLPDAVGQHRASVRELSKSVDSTEGLNEAVDEALKKKKSRKKLQSPAKDEG